MVKELAFYQFNFLDSINERVLARLSKIDNINCEVYQNSNYAIIICPTETIIDKFIRHSRQVYLFSTYKESLVEVPENDFPMISRTISKIME